MQPLPCSTYIRREFNTLVLLTHQTQPCAVRLHPTEHPILFSPLIPFSKIEAAELDMAAEPVAQLAEFVAGVDTGAEEKIFWQSCADPGLGVSVNGATTYRQRHLTV